MSSLNISLEELASKLSLNSQHFDLLKEKVWILAFSGGADSLLCLHFLTKFHESFPESRELYIYYLDHGENFPREIQKNREKIFQENISRLKNLPLLNFYFKKFKRDIALLSKKLKTSFEFAGARLRRKHLNNIARKIKKNYVFIWGHNLSDWYETLQMRLSRGTSLYNIIPFNFWEYNYKYLEFRPLALTYRSEVRDILNESNISYWNDPSNMDLNFKRNYIRKNWPVSNPEGLRKSAIHFLSEKKSNLINSSLVNNISNQEFRIFFEKYKELSLEKQTEVIQFSLKNLGLWPMSQSIRKSLCIFPFFLGPYAVELENWNEKIYIIIRRGSSKLYCLEDSQKCLKYLDNFFWINGTKISKKNYIQLNYGKKSIKKIFSEKKISQRQRKNIYIPTLKKNKQEGIYLPLSLYGLKDYFSIHLQ